MDSFLYILSYFSGIFTLLSSNNSCVAENYKKQQLVRERAVKYYSESIKTEMTKICLKFTFNACKRNKALKKLRNLKQTQKNPHFSRLL